MSKPVPAFIATLHVLLGVSLAGCSDDPFSGLLGNCDPPAGTVAFRFTSGGMELAGFIDAPPASAAPHPAILLIHGEGPTDALKGAGDFAELRDAFRRAGIATVVWDKAGSGCSTGRYRGIADLYVRADEVLAAVDALKMRDDIDPGRIGAWAIGQGGWVAPMAAVRDGLAFLIIVGGSAHDPIRQRLYLVRRNLELDGYPAEESQALVERLGEALRMMADQAPYEEYVQAVEPVAEHPFMEKLMDLAADVYPTERRYDELRGSGALDVSTEVFLPAVDVPVLAIWGGLDSQVDWQEAQRVYRDAFTAGREGDLTARVFEGANHRLCTARTGSLEEARSSGDCDLVDGYVETMTSWLRSRGFASPAQSSVRR